MAEELCIRIDADIIPNENIKLIEEEALNSEAWMIQYKCFDFYKNKVGIGSPVFYRKNALEEIKKNINKISITRPEATAWRLPKVVEHTMTSDLVVGSHGFFQDIDTMERAKKNKDNRGQMKDYDFELVEKIKQLGWKL